MRRLHRNDIGRHRGSGKEDRPCIALRKQFLSRRGLKRGVR